MNLTTRGNYKWLEKALNQKHRFYRGNGCQNLEKFKFLKELQDEIKRKHHDECKRKESFKAAKFIKIDVRGRIVWVENCVKSVRLLLTQDQCIEDIKWVVENLQVYMNTGCFRAKPESGDESSSDDCEETDTDSCRSRVAKEARKHPKCVHVSYRPSRSSFLVKRREEECCVDSQSTLEQQSQQSLSSSASNVSLNSNQREFYVLRPRGRRVSEKSQAAKKTRLELQEPQGVEPTDESRQAWTDCLKKITAWLDGPAEPQELPEGPERAPAPQTQPLEPQVQPACSGPQGPQGQDEGSCSSDRCSESGHHMGQGPGPLG